MKNLLTIFILSTLAFSAQSFDFKPDEETVILANKLYLKEGQSTVVNDWEITVNSFNPVLGAKISIFLKNREKYQNDEGRGFIFEGYLQGTDQSTSFQGGGAIFQLNYTTHVSRGNESYLYFKDIVVYDY